MKLTIEIESDNEVTLIQAALLLQQIRELSGIKAALLVAVDGQPLKRMRRDLHLNPDDSEAT